jgi:hypothetical protein
VWPGDPYACVLGEVAQAAGGGVPVHPGAAAVEQDRPASPVCGGAVGGPADRRGQRDQDDLGAFAANAQDAVAVFLAQVGDAGAGGFEDPQAQQPVDACLCGVGSARLARVAGRNEDAAVGAGPPRPWQMTRDSDGKTPAALRSPAVPGRPV